MYTYKESLMKLTIDEHIKVFKNSGIYMSILRIPLLLISFTVGIIIALVIDFIMGGLQLFE